MQHTAFTQSIGQHRGVIGARAAQHINIAFRRLMRGPHAEHAGGFIRVTTGEPHPLSNTAVVSEPSDPAVTRAAVGPLLEGGFPSSVQYPRGVTDSVACSVMALGFERKSPMPAMAVEIGRLAPTALPPGYERVRVGTGDDARAWTEALSVGFDVPRGFARLFSPESLGADGAPDADIQFFAIVHDGRTVATSLLLLADDLAGIYCVATLPEERRKGLGAHVTAEALRAAQRLGYHVGVLQSSAAGHSVYLRLGFDDLGEVPIFIRVPA